MLAVTESKLRVRFLKIRHQDVIKRDKPVFGFWMIDFQKPKYICHDLTKRGKTTLYSTSEVKRNL